MSAITGLTRRQTNTNTSNNDNDDVRCYTTIYGNIRCYDSPWDSWVRWLVLALIIVAILLLFFSFSCISARRRRKMGYSPYRGTGWALGRTPAGHAPAQYTNQQQPYYQNAQPYYNNNGNMPPPAYTPPSNGGYYGQQNHNGPYGNDVELQQPSSTYGGYRNQEAGVYEPPKGAPPVVR